MTTLEQYCPVVKAVHGNIDDLSLRKRWPEDLVMDVDGLRVWMTHIGGSPGRYTKRVEKLWNDINPGLFVCGHSHILKIMYDKSRQTLFINPGAAGRHGFHIVRTAVRFEIAEFGVRNLDVIQFGKRAQVI